MKTKHLLLAAVAFAVLALAPAAAQADPLVFTLNNAIQTGTIGQTLIFSATVSNPGTAGMNSLTINGDNFSFAAPPQLTLDDALYFTNFDLRTLAVGGMFTGNLFTVNIGVGTAPGTYSGSFTLFYDGVLTGREVTQDFRVTVQAPGTVPEPTTMVLLGTALSGLAALRRRQRHRQTERAL